MNKYTVKGRFKNAVCFFILLSAVTTVLTADETLLPDIRLSVDDTLLRAKKTLAGEVATADEAAPAGKHETSGEVTTAIKVATTAETAPDEHVESKSPIKTLQLSEKSELKMVTIFPGEALYSMFGHTAIRVIDPVLGIDLLYNYGQSSVPFDASFIPRFVTGELPFMLGVIETRRSYDFYRNYENRTIYEQELLLSLNERQAVFDYLEVNALPENRTYIYDFFHDNCTTRVRDLFWVIFGQDIDFNLPDLPVQSYRNAISPYLEEKLFVKFGINLMLGSPTDDSPITQRRLYLPGQLMDAVAAAKIDGRPLMGDTNYVYEGRNGTTVLPQSTSDRPLLTRALSTFFSPSGLLWIVCAAAILLSLSRYRYSVGLRIIDAVLFGLTGFVGAASLLLWNFSGYIMTTANYHLLWAWPLHLIAAFFLVKKDSIKKGTIVNGTIKKEKGGIIRWYLLVSALAVLGSLVLFPFLPQQLPSPAIPLLLTLALRAAVRATVTGRWVRPPMTNHTT